LLVEEQGLPRSAGLLSGSLKLFLTATLSTLVKGNHTDTLRDIDRYNSSNHLTNLVKYSSFKCVVIKIIDKLTA